jgi:hypothetical protein
MAGTEAIISIMKQSGAKDWAFDYSVNFDDFNNSPVKAIQTTIIKLNQLTNVATYSPQMMGFLVNREITPLFDFEYIAVCCRFIKRGILIGKHKR